MVREEKADRFHAGVPCCAWPPKEEIFEEYKRGVKVWGKKNQEWNKWKMHSYRHLSLVISSIWKVIYKEDVIEDGKVWRSD